MSIFKDKNRIRSKIQNMSNVHFISWRSDSSVIAVDGVYVTTRGCSTQQWEDVDVFMDHRNQNLRCFRRGSTEQCLCQGNSCNAGVKHQWSTVAALISCLLVSRAVL